MPKLEVGMRRSRRSVKVAIVGAVFACCATWVSTAYGHYYAQDILDGTVFHGAFGAVEANNFGINPSADFIDNEVWVVLVASNTWEETGLDKGVGGYGCANSTSPHFFWADNRPSPGGYHCHQSTSSANYNTNYPFQIFYLGNGTWNLSTGPYTGTSTAAQTSANELQGGIEETNTSIFTCGHLTGLGWYDGSGAAQNNWFDDSNFYGYFNDPIQPPSLAWDTVGSAFRDWGNESCSSAAVASGTSTSVTPVTEQQARQRERTLMRTAGRQADERRARAASALSHGQIQSIATEVAAEEGDATPTLVQYANAPTRAAANAVTSGEMVPGGSSSIVIEERGSFVGNNVSIPSGQPAPTGHVLTIVVDATTGEITDLGIQDNYPSLSTFGAVTAAPVAAG